MSSLATSINNFISNLENNNNIKNVCLAEKKYIDNKYVTIGSRKSTYSAYRKFIRNSGLIDNIKNETLKIFKLDREEAIIYRNDKVDKVNFKLENLKVITDVEGYIETGISLIKKDNQLLNLLLPKIK